MVSIDHEDLGGAVGVDGMVGEPAGEKGSDSGGTAGRSHLILFPFLVASTTYSELRLKRKEHMYLSYTCRSNS